MTPAAMAELHALAFVKERPWSQHSFETLLDGPFVRVFSDPHGFAMARTLAGESELLTLAVHPDHHRKGIARTLMADWMGFAAETAQSAFLEVAKDNVAALSLYSDLGFRQTGLRRAYYARKDAPAADAVVMSRTLPQR